MFADGSNMVRVTSNLFNDEVPSGSPDGAKVVFASERDGNLEIYLMNVDGRSLIRITNESDTDYVPT